VNILTAKDLDERNEKKDKESVKVVCKQSLVYDQHLFISTNKIEHRRKKVKVVDALIPYISITVFTLSKIFVK
jgi:hypothetical protein